MLWGERVRAAGGQCTLIARWRAPRASERLQYLFRRRVLGEDLDVQRVGLAVHLDGPRAASPEGRAIADEREGEGGTAEARGEPRGVGEAVGARGDGLRARGREQRRGGRRWRRPPGRAGGIPRRRAWGRRRVLRRAERRATGGCAPRGRGGGGAGSRAGPWSGRRCRCQFGRSCSGSPRACG